MAGDRFAKYFLEGICGMTDRSSTNQSSSEGNVDVGGERYSQIGQQDAARL